MPFGFLSTVFRPTVRDRAGVRRYVAAVTFFAWLIAATVDAVQKTLQGDRLADLLFQEGLTLAIVLGIAIPIARTMGVAHLELYLARQQAERLSRTDPLTGLANRRAFYAAAADLRDGAIALAIVDVDRFKRINDQHGHAAGDAALIAVANILRDELADLGLVARLGGEEFGVLSPQNDPTILRERLERFRKKVAGFPLAAEGGEFRVTVSAGFAVGRDVEMDALYSDADRALYVAKAEGRDRVVAFHEIGAAFRRAS